MVYCEHLFQSLNLFVQPLHLIQVVFSLKDASFNLVKVRFYGFPIVIDSCA